MAAKGYRVNVTEAVTEVSSEGQYVRVKNKGANTVDLGGPDVASGAGYELAANEVAEFDCTIDPLYGICAAGLSTSIEVLGVRRTYR
jgi:hypothetical protein